MRRTQRTIPVGFTIVELLIALAVTVVVMTLIGKLFSDTARAVSQGAAMSQILAANRAVSDQIERDADAMISPNDGGFLVIINQAIGDWNNDGILAGDTDGNGIVDPRQGETPTPANDPEGVAMFLQQGGEARRLVRSDQLVFIRKAEDLEPLAPSETNAFNNPHHGSYARMWYGHARRTLPTGLDTGDLGVNTTGNLNRVGTNWILGRQAMVLADSVTGADIYANGNNAAYNAPIPAFSGNPGAAYLFMYVGLSDLSNVPLNAITGSSGVLSGNLTDSAYKTAVYNYTFLTQRLRVNPSPQGTGFESWRVGQMHAALAENVSDFVVEFAVDEDKDGNLEIDGSGNITWFSLANPPSQAAYVHNANHVQTATDVRFTFRHDYPANWPYLIRVRYRLHDPQGRFEQWVGDSTTGQAESGQWFEQIIAVKRN